jgi:hypothetical protein
MENPHKVLDSMERILSDARTWDHPGQLAAFAALKTLIRELEIYVEEYEIPGYGYIHEKLASLNFHVGALYAIDEDNGHDAESHYVWALGDIGTVRQNIPQRQ